MQWTLEIVLVVLLGATLMQALRLERALNVLKRDRSALEGLIARFNISTHQAESGIQRLHAAADGAGRQLDEQVTRSVSLKDDLTFLTERGEKMADRLERLIKAARPLTPEAKAKPQQPAAAGATKEHDLPQALRMAQ
jgi:prefoldin subunit 5